jgi:regulator of protease activity HflC (stomatin/prohibitin superfamily)
MELFEKLHKKERLIIVAPEVMEKFLKQYEEQEAEMVRKTEEQREEQRKREERGKEAARLLEEQRKIDEQRKYIEGYRAAFKELIGLDVWSVLEYIKRHGDPDAKARTETLWEALSANEYALEDNLVELRRLIESVWGKLRNQGEEGFIRDMHIQVNKTIKAQREMRDHGN